MSSERKGTEWDAFLISICIAIVIGVPWGLWHVIHAPLASAALFLASWETEIALPILETLHLPLLDYPAVRQVSAAMPDPASIDFQDVALLLSIAARPFLLPFLIWLWFAREAVMRRRLGEIYNRRITLERLMEIQAANFPWLLPVLHDNPMKDRSGRWDVAATPREWLAGRGIKRKHGEIALSDIGGMLSEIGIDLYSVEHLFTQWRVTSKDNLPLTEQAVETYVGDQLGDHMRERRDWPRIVSCFYQCWLILAAFGDDLGPAWSGVLALPWHQRALYAVFAMRMANLRDEADDMLKRLAKLWTQVPLPKQPMVGAAWLKSEPARLRKRAEDEAAMREAFNALIAEDQDIKTVVMDVIGGRASAVAWPATVAEVKKKGYDLFERIRKSGGLAGAPQRICDTTGFTNVALLSLYACCKERGGVFPSSCFLWLKPCDRRLWYALNSHGRNTPHPEGAAVIAHWRAEVAKSGQDNMQADRDDKNGGRGFRVFKAIRTALLCEALRGVLDDEVMKKSREAGAKTPEPIWADPKFWEGDLNLSGTELYDAGEDPGGWDRWRPST